MAGNRYHAGYSHYSNVYFGQSGFFCNVIAPVHVPFIYGRMLLMALFYQASLRHYREKLMQVTSAISSNVDFDKVVDDVQTLRREFMLFTNGYWFRDVTSQIQGREVFLKQQQALELQRDYEFIKEELVRLDEYMDGQFDKQLGESSNKLNIAVYLFTIVSLWFTFTQMVFEEKFIAKGKEFVKLWTPPGRAVVFAEKYFK